MEHTVVRVQKWTDNEERRPCCRHEVAAEDMAPVDESSSGSHVEAIYIKTEMPDADLEDVTVKEEPNDWNEELQTSSGPGFNAFTLKREVDDVAPEACSGHTEARDNSREGSCDAYNTTTVDQRPAGNSKGSADSLPSDVSGSGSGAKATPSGRLVPQSPYRRAVAASAVVLLLNKLKKKKKKRVWVKKWIERENEERAHAKILRELLSEDPAAHKNSLCMPPEDYYFLLGKVTQKIEKQDTILRQAISPSERLALTLRFLASGDSYRSLMNAFHIPVPTISYIVPDVCLAIYDTLKEEYLKIPKTGEEWTKVAEEFKSKWQFPNCIGALDGKHVVVKVQQNSESLYYNYKGTNSIVLTALVDANCKFLYVDVGCNEGVSDGDVFTNCSLSRALECNSVNVPEARPVDGSDEPSLPYVIVADNAFAMKSYIMKPYPLSNQAVPKRIFNYRLSRARRVVENAFGLLSARFKILRRPIEVAPVRAKQITLCICALHNFLLTRNGSAQTYAPPGMLDSDDAGDVIPGSWREDGMPVSTLHPLQNLATNRNAPQSAKAVREQLTRYFMTEKGELQWQYKSI